MEGSSFAVSPHAETELDVTIGAIAATQESWRQRNVRDKLTDLLAIRDRLEEQSAAWAAASARVRGAKPNGQTPYVDSGSWLAGVALMGSVLNGLIRTYQGRVANGSWAKPPSQRKRANGQVAVTVYPTTLFDKMYAPGYRGEIWLEPGADGSQGAAYDEGSGVCAILGAGNYEAPADILTKMFTENRVVIYKPNPVNQEAAPILERIMAPLVERGYLAFVDGGASAGTALVHHDAVDEVLMTGSAATHDRIVWGEPGEQEKNKREGNKLLEKRFDTELGGVSPVIVVPGQWTAKEIDHHAAQLAANKIINGGHICASPQVFIVDGQWPQRETFFNRVRHHLATARPDPSYYPGSKDRQAHFRDAYPDAESLGPSESLYDTQLDRVLIPNVARDSVVLKEEAFAPVLGEVVIDAGDAQTFLDRAVEFCNDELFGSLSATLLVDPRTERALGNGVDDAVANLEYGAIGVNTWGATIVFFGELSWGAYPKHTAEDIQSGIGTISNTYMVDRGQKSVFWTPFVSPIHMQPLRKRDLKVLPRMARYCANPSAGRLMKLMGAALFGV